MLYPLKLNYHELMEYKNYLLADNANTWDPEELRDAFVQNRPHAEDLTDEEYYNQKWDYSIVGLTEIGKQLFIRGAITEIMEAIILSKNGDLPFSDLNFDLAPWNDPGTEAGYYLSGFWRDPVSEGKEYIRRHYLKNKEDTSNY